MSEILNTDLDSIVQKMIALPATLVYIFIFFSCLIENIFPPWPGDTVTVFSGFLYAHGSVSLRVLLLAIFSGNIAGALIMYFLGREFIIFIRFLAHKIKKPLSVRKSLLGISSAKSLKIANRLFKKYGLWYVSLSRFSAGVRFFVAIVAGLVRMNLVAFVVSFSLGVAIWNGLLLAGGYVLGENWKQLLEWLKIYNVVIFALIAIAAIAYILRNKIKPAPNPE